MNSKICELFNRYLAELSSDEEREIVEDWIDNWGLCNEQAELLEKNMLDIQHDLFEKINSKIVEIEMADKNRTNDKPNI